MADYTPTTEDVRLVWSAFHVRAEGTVLAAAIKANEQFARWLTEHDRVVKAEALRDAAGEYRSPERLGAARQVRTWLCDRADRIDPTEGTRG